MTNTSNQKSYFDLHTTGIGYLQRVREVQPKTGRKSQPFLACTIAALVGPATSPTYRYFDVRVSGEQAKQLVKSYIGVDDPKKRPLVRFRLGDLWVDAFIRPKGKNEGEPAASMKARLLKAELLPYEVLGQAEYHELITHGIGYLQRPKQVSPTNGDPFLSCNIAALSGPKDDVDYRYINNIVVNSDAQHLVRRCVHAVESEKKVLISFRLNDMKAEAYIRTRGDDIGKVAASLESKLIHIGSIKIDGELIYRPNSESKEVNASENVVDEANAAEAEASLKDVDRREGDGNRDNPTDFVPPNAPALPKMPLAASF